MIRWDALYMYKTTSQRDDPEFRNLVMYVRKHGDDLWFFQPDDRPHGFEGEVTTEREDGFTFLCKGYDPGEWDFKRLTYEDFGHVYYKQVYGGKEIAAAVSNTEELYEWFRKKFPKDPPVDVE